MPKSVQIPCPEFSEMHGIKPQNKLNLMRILWLNRSPVMPFVFSLGRVVFKKSVFKLDCVGLSIEVTYQKPNKIILGGFL